MRIKSLSVKDFFILKNDFKINFDNNISVIIGENGSGKSTLLELIADIFGHLHKYFILNDKTADFVDGYCIVYEYIKAGEIYTIEIKSHYVNQKTNTFAPEISINGEKLSISQVDKKYGGMTSFLPAKIVLNYTGISDHLKQLSEHFEHKFTQSIIKANNNYSLYPLNLPKDRPFIYIKPEHLSIITLSLLLSTDTSNKKFISDYLGIDENSCEIELMFKKPFWAKKSSSSKWWGSSGNVAEQFLDTVYNYADIKDYNKSKSILTCLFYGTLSLWDSFRKLEANKSEIVFMILDTLLFDDLLSDIQISWKQGENGINLSRLSEGQKQIILTAGINHIFGYNENILYLFDEPDVFLHPKWQQSFLDILQRGFHNNSMAIITTHNPILIGNIPRKDIHIIKDGQETPNEYFSFGRDVNSLLYDYFNIHERSSFGESLIQNFYDAMNKKDYHQAEAILTELRTTFGEGDIEVVRADSMYDDLTD